MRSAVIAALLSVVAAVPLTETIYNTQVLTITSCGPQVTDCPGKKVTVDVPVTTTDCPESDKTKPTAPPVYHSTSEAVVSSYPAPPPQSYTKPATSEAVKPSSEAPKPSTSEAVKTSPAPPPQSYTKPAPPPETTKAVPPPVHETSTPVAPPSSAVTPKPPVGTSAKPSGTGSTGVVPYKTTSAVWSQTTGPAKYTGAASHLNAAGFVAGAGAFAALFL